MSRRPTGEGISPRGIYRDRAAIRVGGATSSCGMPLDAHSIPTEIRPRTPMTVLPQADIETFRLPGLVHQTLASLTCGTYTMEVWRQTLAPGAVTPWHQHACEKVIVILAGHGECRVPGRTETFGPDATLIVQSDAVHQLANTGNGPLELLAAMGMTPVTMLDATGHPLELPWTTPLPASAID
jgi:mannose-6-phosphate isomerase-like protein (cupin superfamily)